MHRDSTNCHVGQTIDRNANVNEGRDFPIHQSKSNGLRSIWRRVLSQSSWFVIQTYSDHGVTKRERIVSCIDALLLTRMKQTNKARWARCFLSRNGKKCGRVAYKSKLRSSVPLKTARDEWKGSEIMFYGDPFRIKTNILDEWKLANRTHFSIEKVRKRLLSQSMINLNSISRSKLHVSLLNDCSCVA